MVEKKPRAVVCDYSDVSGAMQNLCDDFAAWMREHREVIGLRSSGPGTVINHNNFSINLRSPDITLVLR